MVALAKEIAVGIVGAGAMGAGIAQVAAAAGHRVLIHDVAEGAAAKGLARIDTQLGRLVEKGRMEPAERAGLIGRISVADTLDEFREAGLVIEAVVERLDVKRTLFEALEKLVSHDTILATNTSSISITAIAAGMAHPGRFVGMHFFNPAPLMKLVEVISGLETTPAVASAVIDTAGEWGKVAVPARSTPGFIVNRVARPYYGEALRLYEEQVADPVTIDALMTECGGFRMGPFALMDLIGNDVNYAVSESVFAAYHADPRYRPSLAQKELVDAGWLGRKSGRGFFEYGESARRAEPATVQAPVDHPALTIDPLGGEPVCVCGVTIALSDGRTAAERAADEGRPVILHDLFLDRAGATRIGFAASRDVPQATIDRFIVRLADDGKRATRLPDWPGLVVMRTVAMLANEAFEAVLTGVGTESDIDRAMLYGVNYPAGPAQWARKIGLPTVLAVLDALHAATGDPRYRASYGLRRAARDTKGCSPSSDRSADNKPVPVRATVTSTGG